MGVRGKEYRVAVSGGLFNCHGGDHTIATGLVINDDRLA